LDASKRRFQGRFGAIESRGERVAGPQRGSGRLPPDAAEWRWLVGRELLGDRALARARRVGRAR